MCDILFQNVPELKCCLFFFKYNELAQTKSVFYRGVIRSMIRALLIVMQGKLMKYYLTITALLLLVSCGTAYGLLNGTGEILEGVARDVRGAGGYFE